MEASMGQPPNPPAPPGGGAGGIHLYPELLRTNRQILAAVPQKEKDEDRENQNHKILHYFRQIKKVRGLRSPPPPKTLPLE